MDLEEYHAAWRRFCRPSIYEPVKPSLKKESTVPNFSDIIDSVIDNTSSVVGIPESMHPITDFVLNASDEQLEAFDYLGKWMREYGIEFYTTGSCECEHVEVINLALRLATQRLGSQ